MHIQLRSYFYNVSDATFSFVAVCTGSPVINYVCIRVGIKESHLCNSDVLLSVHKSIDTMATNVKESE